MRDFINTEIDIEDENPHADYMRALNFMFNEKEKDDAVNDIKEEVTIDEKALDELLSDDFEEDHDIPVYYDDEEEKVTTEMEPVMEDTIEEVVEQVTGVDEIPSVDIIDIDASSIEEIVDEEPRLEMNFVEETTDSEDVVNDDYENYIENVMPTVTPSEGTTVDVTDTINVTVNSDNVDEVTIKFIDADEEDYNDEYDDQYDDIVSEQLSRKYGKMNKGGI